MDIQGDKVSDLIRTLGSKSNSIEARTAAAWDLGIRGPEAEPAVPVLIDALKRGPDSVREYAAWALGEIASTEDAMLALVGSLHDRVIEVRQLGASALGKCGASAVVAIPALIETLNDSVPMVRMAAAEALGEIGPAAKAAVPALTEALTDSSWMVQASAAWALNDITPGTDHTVS